MKFIDPEEIKANNEEEKESKPVEVYKEEAEPEMPEIDDAQIRALALAYARYLKDHGLAPGDATFAEPEDLGVSADGLDIDFEIDFDEEKEASKEPEELEEVEVQTEEPAEEPSNEEEPSEEDSEEEDVPEEAEAEESVEEPTEEPAEEPEEEPSEEEPSEETAEEEEIPEETAEAEEPVDEEVVSEEVTEESTEEEEPAEEETSEESVDETASEEVIEEATEEEAPAEETESSEEEPEAEEKPEENLVEESTTEEEPETEETPEESAEESEEITEEEPTEETADEEVSEEDVPEEKPSEEAPDEDSEEKKKETPKQKAAREARERAAKKKIEKRNKAKEKKKQKFLKGGRVPFAAVTNVHDKVQDGIDGAFVTVGKQLIRGFHRISSTYRNSRKVIGFAILFTGLLAAGLLIIFDMFTVYEYAYNGKVLGYVNNQEEVTDVLDVASRQLTSNSSTVADVKFVANQNVTFNPVDGRGKSTDDSDTVVNKLIYMTDIETEAYAVCDGDKVVAIVKDQNDADKLLLQTKENLSQPDRGMKLVSAEFTNELSVKPVNVLLGSVQSNNAAQEQMTNGGDMNTYHIVEQDETIKSIASLFGVEEFDVYNEDNSEPVTEIEQGDRVCVRNRVEPVSVKMIEEGKLKEVIEFETIKKETDEYYKGDTHLEQEGQDGIQIFEGRITKIGGEVTKRSETVEPEILQEKKDKIILVGTAERPKTAATGTFIMPIEHYVITSEWGGRWGRMHEGMDFGAGTGTPIYAADGGRVIKANYWSGHGLCVEIDHGNGVVTRYSHCSAVHVSIGDLVYQGQHIANVGNTGHSFGSHLHFEVRINDVSQNPRNYVNP